MHCHAASVVSPVEIEDVMRFKSIPPLVAFALLSTIAAPNPAAAIKLCGGRPCQAGPSHPGQCGLLPAGCVCEYSPRTGTWGKACPKNPHNH